jgi:hypothetical protein
VIYFIQAESGGPIKIGYAVDVTDRVAVLQTGHPEALCVLAICDGTQRDERQIHADLASYRLRGEWFDDCPQVREYMNRVGGPYVPPKFKTDTGWSERLVETFFAALEMAYPDPATRAQCVARDAGVSKRAIQYWLIGKSLPQTAQVLALASQKQPIAAWLLAWIDKPEIFERAA